jgi:pimeloyl-ACP methyl ester carboxylesterase
MATVLASADSLAHAADALPPRIALLAREAAGFAHMRWTAAFGRAVPIEAEGAGRPVMIVPGLLASDTSTARLRRTLSAAGYRVSGWGLGRNRGVTADTLDRLHVEVVALGGDAPITLIGWSLGGLIAREYAKLHPDRVARVITLGSPFSGHPRANNAWRVYEMVAGHSVEQPPVAVTLGEKPSVPTVACWSARDGVVAPASARGQMGERDHAHEFDCTHMGFVATPRSIRALGALLQG